MQKGMILLAGSALAMLTGCEQAEAPAPVETTTTEAPAETAPPTAMADPVDPAAAPHRFASWAGKWTGVEGMYVTIAPTEPGKYRLEMQSGLDTMGTYEGSDSEHGIQFERGGEAFTLYRASGEDTGLKYLAGKQQCLKVKDGEGYCRD